MRVTTVNGFTIHRMVTEIIVTGRGPTDVRLIVQRGSGALARAITFAQSQRKPASR